MEIKHVNIEELVPHPKNPRVHPESAIEKLTKSLKQFGWTNPVLASSDGVILAGHARVKAAEKAGHEQVPVIYLPFTGAKADAYLVADNKLAEETEWNTDQLAELLEELEGEIDIDLTGFEEEELESLLSYQDDESLDLGEIDVEGEAKEKNEILIFYFTEPADAHTVRTRLELPEDAVRIEGEVMMRLLEEAGL